jgi:RHS repeat-associated protein
LTGYDVQYWNGSAWTTVTGGSVTGNNKVWRKFTFAAITTSKIRVLTNASVAGFSLLTEVEAWTSPTATSTNSTINWLVTDQLGTPRMVFDQSGSLATTKRHDYAPFGEELLNGARPTTVGYASGDTARQKFTQKERDIETGLDYFGARYFASAQGRFTTADPLMSSGTVENPQSWNRYSYVLNHPLELTDPLGLFVFVSSVTEEQRKGFRSGLATAQANLQKMAQVYGTNSKEYKKAERAVRVYGAEGVKNGVTIEATTDPKANPGGTQVAGVAGSKTADNPNGQDIRITFRSDDFGDDGLDQTISHEGSHAADGSDWVSSGFANSKNPANYQSEVDAFTVEMLQVQADFNNSGTASQIIGGWHKDPGKNPWIPLILTKWDSGWKEADRATMRASNINRLLERPKDAGGYNLTPSNQGGPTFKKGSRF